ncbi:hypothetical protein [Desulfosporosinus sp. OT]|uniref:hypothetical protein n=1 Tax=Desulfosporosinus sp. OT TaxID=913865 RepID=UPI000223AA76|nr:hypothetical protein [Desulfosporosinus sp. OT]EGW39733.1 hypothetical protein DOT_2348 [Desulfosporosinus sp. OT]
MDSKKGIIFTGAVIGILAVVLVRFGNPVNMGICISKSYMEELPLKSPIENIALSKVSKSKSSERVGS